MKISVQSPLMCWIVKHSAWLNNRYQLHQDGKTSFERRWEKNYRKHICEFGETILFQYSAGIPDKTTSSWDYGIWLGRCTQSYEHFVGTKDNIYRTRTVRRLPEKDKYDVKLLEAILSTPWATRDVGKAPTVEFVLPLPVPPLFDYKAKRRETTGTKEETTAETNTTTEPNPSRTTVNVETGGTDQEGGATSSGTTRGTTRPSEVEQELPPPKIQQQTQGATSPTEEPRGSIRGPDALPDDDVREHKSRMIEALHKHSDVVIR